MADSDSTPNPSACKIVAHDEAGDEHALTVGMRTGLVVVRDDEVVRIFSPNAALELAHVLIELVLNHRRDDAGPLSASF